MSLERLLGDTSKRDFIENSYLQQPFSKAGGARELVELGSWRTIDTILPQQDVDVLVARQGELRDDPAPPTPAEARQLHSDGWTLVIRHAEKHVPELDQLADSFRRDFCGEVNIHLYCTPGDQYGFGWHYDAEDVFILQTEGVKEYSLRKNTVHPWPLMETIPHDMQFGAEIMPVMKCALSAGDWLYIPPGYWHVAQSQQPAVSLALGVMSTAAIDVYDHLRNKLLGSLLWRQRLPPPGAAATLSEEELLAHYEMVLAGLGRELQQEFSSKKLAREFIEARRRAHGPSGESPE